MPDHPVWRKPQHHSDVEHKSDHVHWVELFYDLIHVVVIFLLGNYLSHHLSIEGFFFFAGIFIAIWYAWGDTSVFNSTFVSTDFIHRLMMSAQIATVMFMAAAIPAIPGKGWPYFALAYALNRTITATLYWRALRHSSESSDMAYEMVRNYSVLAVLFVISAFLPAPYSYLLFGASVLAVQFLYMLPKIGINRFERFIPRLAHMSERFALLLLICIGEGFFKLVITLSEKGVYKVPAEVLVNFVLGGFGLIILCWIYFDFVGNAKPKDNKTSTHSLWWLGHLFLMLSAIMIGVALTGEVKVGFSESYPIGYAWLGCTGLALYLSCLLLIQFVIENRAAHEFSTVGLRLFGIALALLTLLAVINQVSTLVGNFLWFSALLSQLLIPMAKAYRKYAT